jgi:hypothetical protein
MGCGIPKKIRERTDIERNQIESLGNEAVENRFVLYTVKEESSEQEQSRFSSKRQSVFCSLEKVQF